MTISPTASHAMPELSPTRWRLRVHRRAVRVRQEGSAETRQWTASTAPLDRSPIPCMLPELRRARPVHRADLERSPPKTAPRARLASTRVCPELWSRGQATLVASPAQLVPLPIPWLGVVPLAARPAGSAATRRRPRVHVSTVALGGTWTSLAAIGFWTALVARLGSMLP